MTDGEKKVLERGNVDLMNRILRVICRQNQYAGYLSAGDPIKPFTGVDESESVEDVPKQPTEQVRVIQQPEIKKAAVKPVLMNVVECPPVEKPKEETAENKELTPAPLQEKQLSKVFSARELPISSDKLTKDEPAEESE